MKEDAMQQDRAVDVSLKISILLSATIFVAVLPTSIASGQDDEADALQTRIELWLQQWKNPTHPDHEVGAISGLFGRPALGRGFHPPDDIKAMLFKRGLNYEYWKSRRAALLGFQHTYLEFDPEPLLPLFRDGLNDSRPEIRHIAVTQFGAALQMIESGGRGARWDAATKARILENRVELVDMIVDQVITKGLADEDEKVVDHTLALLSISDPTKQRLRVLDRVIARNLIQFPLAIKKAEAIQSEWQDKLDGIKEPKPIPENKNDAADDPFGN